MSDDDKVLALAWLRVKAAKGKTHAQTILDELTRLQESAHETEMAYDGLFRKYEALQERCKTLETDRKTLQQLASELNEELRVVRSNYTVTKSFEVLHG